MNHGLSSNTLGAEGAGGEVLRLPLVGAFRRLWRKGPNRVYLRFLGRPIATILKKFATRFVTLVYQGFSARKIFATANWRSTFDDAFFAIFVVIAIAIILITWVNS